MYHISQIQIKNLRSIHDEVFSLSHFTPLIGVNDVGKSAILRACEWAVGIKPIHESDWNDKTKPVEVIVYGPGDKLLLRKLQEHPLADEKYYVSSKSGSWKKASDQDIQNYRDTFDFPIVIDSFESDDPQSVHDVVGKVLLQILGSIEEKYAKSMSETMHGVHKSLARDRVVQDFNSQASEELKTFFPSLNLSLNIPTPDLRDILLESSVTVTRDNDADTRSVDRMGNGAKRSIQMALLQYLAKALSTQPPKKKTTLLLIDEPEIYLHPSAIEQVRVALKKLSNLGYQVTFATHSAGMVTSEDVSHALLIRKDETRGTYAKQRFIDAIKSVSRDAKSQVEMMFTLSNASQVLFSERVLLIEGKTELRILPILYEHLTGKTLGLHKVAIVNQDSASNTKKSMQVLRAMGIPSQAIVDLDYAFTHGPSHGIIRKTDPDYQTCLHVFQDMHKQGLCNLEGNGLPTNKNSPISASQAFALMAQNPKAKQAIHNIAQTCLRKHIWLWTLGAIEEHLGTHGKSEQIWSWCAHKIEKEGTRWLEDEQGIQELIEWIRVG